MEIMIKNIKQLLFIVNKIKIKINNNNYQS